MTTRQQAERTLAAADRALTAAEALAAVRACPRALYVAELTAGVAGGPGWLAYRAEQATRLRALADSAWLSAARWGRWEAAAANSGPVALLAGQSAKVAAIVAVARGVRAAKMA